MIRFSLMIMTFFTASLAERVQRVLVQWTGKKTMPAKYCFLHLLKTSYLESFWFE